MSKFTVTCQPCDYTCSIWIECDESKAKEYGDELCRQIFNDEDAFQILPGHLSEEAVGVHFKGEGPLEELLNQYQNPELDQPKEWFLERGFVTSFGSF